MMYSTAFRRAKLGRKEHAVGRSCVGFYRAVQMVKPNTCAGPSLSGMSGLAVTSQ